VNLRQVYKYLDDNPDIANINRDVVESPINTYVTDLLEKPVFTILRDPSGKYFVKNRMSEIVSVNEFKKFYKNISWDE
jgi:hypothetical protein